MFCLKDHTPTRFSRILKSKILENREREYSGWFKTWLLGHQHFFNRCWHERYRDVSTDIATSMTSLWQDFQEFRISRFLKFWMSHPSVSQSITQWPGFSRILKSEILEIFHQVSRNFQEFRNPKFLKIISQSIHDEQFDTHHIFALFTAFERDLQSYASTDSETPNKHSMSFNGIHPAVIFCNSFSPVQDCKLFCQSLFLKYYPLSKT